MNRAQNVCLECLIFDFENIVSFTCIALIRMLLIMGGEWIGVVKLTVSESKK